MPPPHPSVARPPAVRVLVACLGACAALTLAACSGASATRTSATHAPTTASTSSPASTASSAPSTSSTPSTTAARSTSAASSSAASSSHPEPATTGPLPTPVAGAPVIVLDPGHSPTIDAIDPANGLNVSDYENEPEMHDVFAVAQLVRVQLLRAGYRVVMTKTSVYQHRSLLQRAQIADAAHASLALSIHDQAGSNGGIDFTAGNNTVYYQSTGTYRATASGHRVYFTNSALAAISERYGRIFRQQRQRVEGVPITLLGDTGYDLGGRGLAGGDIWMVQLLSHVPWVYNESGGNSAGQVGLSTHDKQVYADALVAAVEHCIEPPR